jgi:hypothetical protein
MNDRNVKQGLLEGGYQWELIYVNENAKKLWLLDFMKDFITVQHSHFSQNRNSEMLFISFYIFWS